MSGFKLPSLVNMTAMAGFGDVLNWTRQQVTSRVPKADLDQRDPDYIREQLPGLWLLASLYFRADVRGLERIPKDGPVLLVGNHSGGNLPPDTFVFTLAFCSYFGVERPFYQLAHNLVVSMPGLGSLRKFGTVAANHENAELALDSGAALLVYPGGDYEVFRPSWQRHEVDFGGRKGYVKLAREAGVPIVPIASVGGQEAALFLDRGQWLAKLLMVDKLARLKSVPILLAPPWGLTVSDMVPRLPLPTKIAIEVQDPIDADDIAVSDDDVVHDKVEAACRPAWTGWRPGVDSRCSADEGPTAVRRRRRPRHGVEDRQRSRLLPGVHGEPRALGGGRGRAGQQGRPIHRALEGRVGAHRRRHRGRRIRSAARVVLGRTHRRVTARTVPAARYRRRPHQGHVPVGL